jgi:hypothetical protein
MDHFIGSRLLRNGGQLETDRCYRGAALLPYHTLVNFCRRVLIRSGAFADTRHDVSDTTRRLRRIAPTYCSCDLRSRRSEIIGQKCSGATWLCFTARPNTMRTSMSRFSSPLEPRHPQLGNSLAENCNSPPALPPSRYSSLSKLVLPQSPR